MKVNVDKTKILIFSKGRMPVNFQFKSNGNDIEIVKDFNYLGIYFSRSGSFKTCKKNQQAEKAIKAMNEVLKKGRKHNLSISCQLDLFDKLMKPILLYGCEVWGFGNNEILERVQLKFCKRLLHLKTTTPNCMVYGELGRYPVENDIKLRINFYFNYICMSYFTIFYPMQVHLNNFDVYRWCPVVIGSIRWWSVVVGGKNTHHLLTGSFTSMSTKIILKSFMTMRPELRPKKSYVKCCLIMLLSTSFQLYCGSQIYRWRNTE